MADRPQSPDEAAETLPAGPSLSSTMSATEKSRKVSSILKKAYDALTEELEYLEGLQVDTEEKREKEHKQALLGIELAQRARNEIDMEREMVKHKRALGVVTADKAETSFRLLNKRHISAGDDLWRHTKKKQRHDDPGAIQLFHPGAAGLAESMLSLYRKCDG